MATTNPKMRALLSGLLRRTEAGLIEWSGGARADTFTWSGASASVMLLSKDNDGVAPWVIRLVDEEGRLVEEQIFQRTSDPDDQLVQHLYDAARRSARNVDATIDALLEDLDQ